MNTEQSQAYDMLLVPFQIILIADGSRKRYNSIIMQKRLMKIFPMKAVGKFSYNIAK